uniref:Alpha-2-MRAP_C domain-containing protein n=1 Tax=Syphacia muris TaxID=451379 RepID=A0A0N5ABD8_9BILA
MLQRNVIYSLLLCLLFYVAVFGSKGNDLPKNNPFRTAKMNFIWTKAIHHLGDKSVLKAVKKELARFDSLYLSAKERSIKSGRNDIDQVDRKLMETLRRFNLQDTVTAFNQKRKWRSDNDDQRKKNTFIGSERFDDKKLNKLWEAALSGHFSDYQLKSNCLSCFSFLETELESIRLELAHFDKHIDRLRYHEQEFEVNLNSKTGKKDVVAEGLNEFESDLLRLKRKLKKFEKQLESRIRHSEL